MSYRWTQEKTAWAVFVGWLQAEIKYENKVKNREKKGM